MKKGLIVALVCLNVALLGAVIGTNMPRAQAQVIGGTDYLAITAHISDTIEAVYVIDLARGLMGGWQVNRTTKKLSAIQGTDLMRDFGREKAGGPVR